MIKVIVDTKAEDRRRDFKVGQILRLRLLNEHKKRKQREKEDN